MAGLGELIFGLIILIVIGYAVFAFLGLALGLFTFVHKGIIYLIRKFWLLLIAITGFGWLFFQETTESILILVTVAFVVSYAIQIFVNVNNSPFASQSTRGKHLSSNIRDEWDDWHFRKRLEDEQKQKYN